MGDRHDGPEASDGAAIPVGRPIADAGGAARPAGEGGAVEPEVIPLEPVAPPARPSVLRAAPGEGCPRCGAALPGEAVVCLACGFDMRANAVRATQVAAPVVVEPPRPPEVLFPEGFPGVAVSAYGAGVLAIGAAVLAGVYHDARMSGVQVFGSIVLTFYLAALHTGTAVVAGYGGAYLLGIAAGRVEMVAARMGLAVAAAAAVSQLPAEQIGSAGPTIGVLAAAGVYFLVLWGGVRRQPRDVAVVGALHLALVLIVSLGSVLERAVQVQTTPASGQATAPAAGAGG